MANKLYKVNVEVDVYVSADGLASAAKIAREHAGQEIPEFGLAHASEVESIYSLPEDWEKTIPYSKGAKEIRNCAAIMKAVKESSDTVEIVKPEPAPEPVKKEKEHKPTIQPEEFPVELPKNDDNLPQLRFKI
jgi:hypothetical protein